MHEATVLRGNLEAEIDYPEEKYQLWRKAPLLFQRTQYTEKRKRVDRSAEKTEIGEAVCFHVLS